MRPFSFVIAGLVALLLHIKGVGRYLCHMMREKEAQMMFYKIGIFGAVLMLAACGTPEYRAEQSQCRTTWNAKIPPRLERELYTRTETRRVPTGRTICRPQGNRTICDQVMRVESFSVPAVRTVDRNKPRRDAQIKACAQNTCLKKFGNPECKAPK